MTTEPSYWQTTAAIRNLDSRLDSLEGSTVEREIVVINEPTADPYFITGEFWNKRYFVIVPIGALGDYEINFDNSLTPPIGARFGVWNIGGGETSENIEVRGFNDTNNKIGNFTGSTRLEVIAIGESGNPGFHFVDLLYTGFDYGWIPVAGFRFGDVGTI